MQRSAAGQSSSVAQGDEHVASIGKLELKMQEKETVSVPLVVSIAAIAAGVGLLVGFGKK